MLFYVNELKVVVVIIDQVSKQGATYTLYSGRGHG